MTFWSISEALSTARVVGGGMQAAFDIALAIENTVCRSHIRQNIETVAASHEGEAEKQIGVPMELDCDPQTVLNWLGGYFERDGKRSVILISDLLLREAPDSQGRSFASQCQAVAGDHSLGLIGVLPKFQRAPDVDRLIRPDISPAELDNAVSLVIQRLQYLRKPLGENRLASNSVSILPIRPLLTEFMKYFALRHRVYKIMGYLDPEMENCKLEMNEADVHSIHLGAFHAVDRQTRLVGTIRMVTYQNVDPTSFNILENLAKTDRVLRNRIKTPYSLCLPIFETYSELNRQIKESLRGDGLCGEISRVIVEREFRGNGIAHLLIEQVLQRSLNQGIRQVFLECLKTHESLYKAHGFSRIAGLERPPIDVNRTMIAMQKTQRP